ncbi:MAG: endonuclease/exonuclease/phosphatase family protein [Armatimonadetes bacterium]|nr:endonuclease/exonuclease/phosphatase family protein [Armatimonadota bacterium]
MAQSRTKWPRSRAVLIAVYAVFLVSWAIAKFGDDDTSFVAMATGSIGGLVLFPLTVVLTWLAVRKRWADVAVGAACLPVYFVLTGQAVWNVPRSAPRDETLRVLQFNIEHGRNGPARIAAIVREQDIDVFAFQECSDLTDIATTLELKRLLPDYSFLSDGSRTSGSRLPVLYQSVHKLTPFDYSWTMIEQTVDFHGRPVRVLNVHAPSYLPEQTLDRPPLDWGRRWGEVGREQSGLVTQELMTVASSEVSTVLCGDFNMTPGSRRYGRIASLAQDVFLAAGRGTGWTSPAFLPVRRIDYVWAFPGVEPLDCTVLNGSASDHSAVVAVLKPGTARK